MRKPWSSDQKTCNMPARCALRYGLNLGVSFVLAASVSAALPFTVYASEQDVANAWSSVAGEALSKGAGYQPYAVSGTDAVALTDDLDVTKLPSKYDLRDPNGDGDRSDSVVTSVKNQSPWGSCWGFAAIAASETSILSESGKTASSGLDLSELQLANAAFVQAPASVVGTAQAGEGFHNDSQDATYGLDRGGLPLYASRLFAAGVGPLTESEVPYKNAEGIKRCLVKQNGTETTQYLTDEQIAKLEADDDTVVVRSISWAGVIKGADTKRIFTDWSVSDELWNQANYEFEDGNILPETRVLNEDGTQMLGVDESAIASIKNEICNKGRAVSCAFYAETSLPEQAIGSKDKKAQFISKNWAHYTNVVLEANHAVTIVGWDDNYDASNFAIDGDGARELPPGNGAWLVKNSWGAEGEEFPNEGSGDWGIVEDGKHTGYFWLSYYDQSITEFESFDYDLNTYSDNDEYYIDQYDYLVQGRALVSKFDSKVSTANIFTAEGDLAVRSLSCETYAPGTTVTYQVYLLDDAAETPTDPEHSKLVLERVFTYDYAGYHRSALDSADWVAMREGQRYAVVTTQKDASGTYYQGIAVNMGTKPTDAEVSDYSVRTYQQLTRDCYTEEYERVKQEKLDAGATEEEAEEAAAAAAEAKIVEQESAIQADADYATDIFANTYYVSRVNAGESWTTSVGDEDTTSDGEETWYDWLVVKNAVEAKSLGDGSMKYVADNAAIKAVSEVRDWASVASLDKLSEALTQAKAVLKNAKISADGSDVDKKDTWITQAEHDTLATAIDTAVAKLALAGDFKNTLANTTPTSDDVTTVTASLAVNAQAGTKGDSGSTTPDEDGQDKGDKGDKEDQADEDKGANNGDQADEDNQDNKDTRKKKGTTDGDLPGTGDYNDVATIASVLVAACAAAVVSVATRRQT